MIFQTTMVRILEMLGSEDEAHEGDLLDHGLTSAFSQIAKRLDLIEARLDRLENAKDD